MTFDIWDALMVGFYLGTVVGWWFNRKQPKIEANLKINKDFIDAIEQERVFAWLDARGLVWQPKGAVFDPDRKISK